MVIIKEQYLELASVYLQVARQLETSEETPKAIAGALFEKHCHQHDLAKDSQMSFDRIAQSLKNVVREYVREKMQNEKLSFDDAMSIVCVSEAAIVLRYLGVTQIAFYDKENTIVKL